jgi:division protein CdvB (Snf7/Vps24/ESCRT-III family)
MTRSRRFGLVFAVAMTLAAEGLAEASHNKRCDAANKRVARELKDVTATLDALGRERKARESCTARNACARIDASIATLEKRHQRHEVRMVRSRAEAIEACKP